MKNLLLTVMVFFIVGCTVKTGDGFVGAWRAQGDVTQTQGVFYIADRLLIEKDGDHYKASLLAQGVFANMTYDKDTGYLCTDKGACFELVDKNTLRMGTTAGLKKYIREKDEVKQ